MREKHMGRAREREMRCTLGREESACRDQEGQSSGTHQGSQVQASCCPGDCSVLPRYHLTPIANASSPSTGQARVESHLLKVRAVRLGTVAPEPALHPTQGSRFLLWPHSPAPQPPPQHARRCTPWHLHTPSLSDLTFLRHKVLRSSSQGGIRLPAFTSPTGIGSRQQF